MSQEVFLFATTLKLLSGLQLTCYHVDSETFPRHGVSTTSDCCSRHVPDLYRSLFAPAFRSRQSRGTQLALPHSFSKYHTALTPRASRSIVIMLSCLDPWWVLTNPQFLLSIDVKMRWSDTERWWPLWGSWAALVQVLETHIAQLYHCYNQHDRNCSRRCDRCWYWWYVFAHSAVPQKFPPLWRSDPGRLNLPQCCIVSAFYWTFHLQYPFSWRSFPQVHDMGLNSQHVTVSCWTGGQAYARFDFLQRRAVVGDTFHYDPGDCWRGLDPVIHSASLRSILNPNKEITLCSGVRAVPDTVRWVGLCDGSLGFT